MIALPYIEIRDVSMHFGATRALTDVRLSLERGEVHGLLGENGAGKSTLTKILSGVVTPDSGTFRIGENDITLGRPKQSRSAGLAMAYQELSAPKNITVAEKLFLPRPPRNRIGLVSRRNLYSKARDVLKDWGQPEIDPRTMIGEIDLADRQHVEIIAALSREPKLLVLDEPTASLQDIDWLFRQVRRLTARGCSVIYISHKLAEIAQICDRGTVLRNGRVVTEFSPGTAKNSELVELMIGRSLNQTFPSKKILTAGPDEPAVTVENLNIGRLSGVSFEVDAGSIVGVAALEGQGQKELFYALAGMLKPDGGDIQTYGDPRVSSGAKPDFWLVPEERKTEGLFLPMSTKANLTISRVSQISFFGTISARRETAVAASAADTVNIAMSALGTPVQDLSGGNQQKVVLGRALMQQPRCLLLYDPTRGVDAATKVEIYHLAREFTKAGGSVLIYSTEIPELVGLCDRVYTLYSGELNGEFSGDCLNEGALMASALGSTRDEERHVKEQ